MTETAPAAVSATVPPLDAGIYVSAAEAVDWPSVALYKLDDVVGEWTVNDRGFWEKVEVGSLPADLAPVGFGAAVKVSGLND